MYLTNLTSHAHTYFSISFMVKSLLNIIVQDGFTSLSESKAVDLIKTCFASATDRHLQSKICYLILNFYTLNHYFLVLH